MSPQSLEEAKGAMVTSTIKEPVPKEEAAFGQTRLPKEEPNLLSYKLASLSVMSGPTLGFHLSASTSAQRLRGRSNNFSSSF